MKECKHDWIGSADGVTCRICGKHLTDAEYKKASEPKKAKGKEAEA